MKIKRNQLLMMLLVTGFFIGILYVSAVKVESAIFENDILLDLKIYKLDYKKYLLYIVKERIGLLLLIIFLGQVHWRCVYAGILTVMIGVNLGSVACISFIGMGIKGLFLCIVGIVPYACCYGLVLNILIGYWFEDKARRWRASKTAGILFFLCLGILSEVYVSPFLMKIFL